MTYTFKLARRLAILRHLVVLTWLALLAACMKDLTAPEGAPTGFTPVATSLQVLPGSVTIETGQPVQFRALTRARGRHSLPTTVAWTTSGGTITMSGTFSASEPGTYVVVGKARGPQHADTSVVVVVPRPSNLVRIEVTPGSAILDGGATHTFTVTGYRRDGSTVPVGVEWSATGGEVDPAGAYTAGPTSGSYRVIATTTSGKLADTATVTINAPEPSAPTLTSVVVSPASTSLMAGGSKQFKVYGRNSEGDSVEVATSFIATGGTITSNGLYTAGPSAGRYRVIATSSGLADTAEVAVVEAAGSPTNPVLGVPFGPSQGWNGTSLKSNMDPFTMSQDATTASSIVERIAEARSQGVHLVLAIVGGGKSQYLTDGVFDLAKWRARLQTFNTPTIRQAVAAGVADGTVIATTAIDEPFHPGWGPKGTFTKARVDSMCEEIKVIFPTLPAGPTHDHDDFEPTKSYRVCDFILSQYRAGKGDVVAFRDAGLALGKRDGHAVAFSLNILDGGIQDRDGTWDCTGPGQAGRGTYSPNCRMTPTQVREFGRVLGPAGCFMMMWRYDDAFMSNAENVRAFQDLVGALAGSSRSSCRRL